MACRGHGDFGSRTNRDLTCRLNYQDGLRKGIDGRETGLTKDKSSQDTGFFFSYDATFDGGRSECRCDF